MPPPVSAPKTLSAIGRLVLVVIVLLLAVVGYEAWTVTEALNRAYFPNVPPSDFFTVSNLLGWLPLCYLLAVAITGRWRLLVRRPRNRD